MKKLQNIKNNMQQQIQIIKSKVKFTLLQTAQILQDKRGFDGISEKTIVIIGVIVVGAAFIGAMLFLFKDTLIPQITTKIQDLFNIK